MAVDIGGTFIKFGLVDEQYRVSGQCKVPTKVCAPGLIDRAGNVKSYAAPSLDGMFGSNIPAEVTVRTGPPCAVINDGKAAGLCELKLGAAKGNRVLGLLYHRHRRRRRRIGAGLVFAQADFGL